MKPNKTLRELHQPREKPSREELFARIGRLPPMKVHPPPTEILRGGREQRRSW